MLQKLLADSAGYLLVLVGLAITVTVGVMSILLPLLVFKIMRQVGGMNRKMARVVELLEAAGKKEVEAPQRQASASGIRLGPTSTGRGDADVGDKPLRFK